MHAIGGPAREVREVAEGGARVQAAGGRGAWGAATCFREPGSGGCCRRKGWIGFKRWGRTGLLPQSIGSPGRGGLRWEGQQRFKNRAAWGSEFCNNLS
jgi:hypothetical protein